MLCTRPEEYCTYVGYTVYIHTYVPRYLSNVLVLQMRYKEHWSIDIRVPPTYFGSVSRDSPRIRFNIGKMKKKMYYFEVFMHL